MDDQASDLRRAAKQQLGRNAPAGRLHQCRVLAVTGGKGGVGKTNVAVNLSLALCDAGARVLLMDADLGLANVDLVLGLSPRYTLQHVIRRQAAVEDIVLEGPLGLHILPGSIGLPEMANLGMLEVVRLLGALRPLEREHDLLVLDTAAGIGQTVLRFLSAADDVIIVTTPEPPAILDAFGLIKALQMEKYAGQLHLLVNMLRQRSELLETHRSLATVAARYFGTPLRLLGGLPLDESIVPCIKQQRPFYLERPHSPVTRALSEIARGLCAEKLPPAAAPTDSFFTRLIGSMR